MLTTVHLSNISYNTRDFLVHQLEDLRKSKHIRFWCFIFHKAEADELKDHIHLYIIPDTRLETSELDDFFIEVDPNNDLPLKCMLWTPAKVSDKSYSYDWLLYSIHDPIYLKLKYGEDKKIHYKKADFVFSDSDIFNDFYFKAYHEFSFWKRTKYQSLLENGASASALVRKGYVDMSEMVSFKYFVDFLSNKDGD